MTSVADFIARTQLPASFETDYAAPIQTALDDAAKAVDLPRCTTNPEQAQVYLAAHFLASVPTVTPLKTALGGETAGPVTAMKAGEISASFSASGSAGKRSGEYSTTAWGRLFETLLDVHTGISA